MVIDLGLEIYLWMKKRIFIVKIIIIIISHRTCTNLTTDKIFYIKPKLDFLNQHTRHRVKEVQLHQLRNPLWHDLLNPSLNLCSMCLATRCLYFTNFKSPSLPPILPPPHPSVVQPFSCCHWNSESSICRDRENTQCASILPIALKLLWI